MPNLPVLYHRVRRTISGDDFELFTGASAFTMAPADVANSALVLIDVWPASVQYWPRAEAITTAVIAPCVNAARAKGMHIVHAPSGQPSHASVWHSSDATIITSDVVEHYAVLDSLLAAWGVNRVFFCGHALNFCTLFRPVSMPFMFMANKMRNHILIEDAGASIEMTVGTGTPLAEATRIMAGYMGEKAYRCTSSNFIAALT